eukprot:TRINITY_DN3825_c0_g1_i1.p1 TRINITY_DN3825_c0_g1~~TRINITY_DN3825_c0_g1_i1.p1  ORF type:complete len:291 (+),score=25.53 TRINITY_DN3825_c0_g1_i1:152-1024(+)
MNDTNCLTVYLDTSVGRNCTLMYEFPTVIALVLYHLVFGLAFSFLLVWVCYAVYYKIMFEEQKWYRLSFIVMYMLIIGLLGRLFYIFDPFRFSDIDLLLWNIGNVTLIPFFSIPFLLILVIWVDIMNRVVKLKKGAEKPLVIPKITAAIFAIVMVVLYSVVYVIIGIILEQWNIVFLLVSLSLLIMAIGFLIMYCAFASIFGRFIKNSGSKQLSQLYNYIKFGVGVMILLLVDGAFGVFRTVYWPSFAALFILECGGRTVECSIVYCVMMIISGWIFEIHDQKRSGIVEF